MKKLLYILAFLPLIAFSQPHKIGIDQLPGGQLGPVVSIANAQWASASGQFTALTGATFNSTGLHMTSSNGTYSFVTKNTYATSAEDWTIQVSAKYNTGSTAGFAVGLESTTTPIRFGLDGSAGTGVIKLSIGSVVYTVSGSIAMAAGDSIKMFVTRSKNKFMCLAINATQNVSTYGEYAFKAFDDFVNLPNSSQFAIYNMGGSNDIALFKIIINTQTALDYLFVGDSITQGYNSVSWDNRFASEFALRTGKRCAVWAAAGNHIADITAGVTEIAATSKTIILMIGTNDLNSSAGTIQTAYAAMITALQNAGVRVIICLITPRNDSPTTSPATINAWLISTYSATNTIIDTYSGFTLGAGNDIPVVHPSVAGHKKIANAIYNALSAELKATNVPVTDKTTPTQEVLTTLTQVNPYTSATSLLQATVGSTDNTITVNTTKDFPSKGFAVLTNQTSSEVISYYGTTPTQLIGVQRALFATSPLTVASIVGWSVYPVTQLVGNAEGLLPTVSIVNGTFNIGRAYPFAAGDIFTVSSGSALARFKATTGVAGFYLDKVSTASYATLVYQAAGTSQFQIGTEPTATFDYLKLHRGTNVNDITIQSSTGNVGIHKVGQVSTLDVGGSFGAATRTMTVTGDALALTDYTLFINITSGANNLTLPNPASVGNRVHKLKNIGTIACTLTSFAVDGISSYQVPPGATLEIQSDGTAWRTTAMQGALTSSATLDFPSTSAQTSSDLTITVTGAAVGDVVSLGVPNASVNANSDFTAWVSASNTVTVRFNNYSSGSIDPASGTFKVKVLQ